MQIAFSRHRLPLSIVLGACVGLCLLGLWMLIVERPVHAASANERVISVYDGGLEKTFITTAQTIGEALDKAGFKLAKQDVAEPSLTAEMVAKNYHVNIYRARPVMVVDGSEKYNLVTAQQSGREIVESAGEKIYPEDDVTMERGGNIATDGIAVQKAVIDRATPITFDLYGKVATSRTQATTVGEILKEKNINLGPKDGVSLPHDTKVTAGMKLRVWRDGKQTTTIEEAVAFPVRQIQDYDREIGYKEVKTPGKKGKRLVTYEIVTKNGKEVSRTEIQSVVTDEPAEQVEIVGAKPSFSGSFAEALAHLRQCEAGGAYDRNSGNGYYGAYQYDISTWANWKGYERPDLAPPAVQDEKVWETYQRRGWQPWPHCGASLPDTYR